MKIRIVAAILLMCSIIVSGCTTNPYTGESQMAKSAKYGIIATTAGGVLGALVGGKKGAMIGAGLGAAMGGGYGYYTDVQENKLREQLRNTGMEVTRNQNNSLTVTMPSDVTFDTGSADIKSVNYQALNSVVGAIRERNGTVMIVGHTDHKGSLELNQSLSLARANSVANYMFAQGVPFGSIKTQGMAFHNPIASEATAEGRAQNRRVEIILQ